MMMIMMTAIYKYDHVEWKCTDTIQALFFIQGLIKKVPRLEHYVIWRADYAQYMNVGRFR